jgi:hypothetical protein
MNEYEYKWIYRPARKPLLLPWASQKTRDLFDVEKTLNDLAAEGWEVISCNTTSVGTFLFFVGVVTVLLRRPRKATS